MRVFAENFRGFRQIEVDLTKINFLVGDNSSGKSSILHLIDCIARNDLSGPPRLNDDLGVGEFDYFSPFFNEADVTFGFTKDVDGREFSKIITVTKGKSNPRVISCSYFSDTLSVSLRRSQSGVRTRVRPIIKPDTRSKLELHHSNDGFTKSRKFHKNVNLSEPGVVFAFIDIGSINDNDFMSLLFGDPIPSARLISPVRALPEKFYTLKRRVNSQGLHFATMWLDLSKTTSLQATSDVEKFGAESGLFEKIRVRPLVSKLADSPLIASVVKSNKEFFLNQVGVGVSQVVPVLVETVFSTIPKVKRYPLLIQQPELHLHPVAQAALGSFFFRAGQRGFRGVLETHSSYLIDRFRAELRDQKEGSERSLNASSVVILFCENSLEGNRATEVLISPDGQLSGEPNTYHRFFVDELIRTMF